MQGASLAFLLAPELLLRLRSFSQQAGATLFMTLLAALASLLARQSGQHDLLLGTPIAGRTRVELEQLIGLFVNTLVLRVQLHQRPSLLTLLAQVRECCLGAYAHQELPFERLVELLQPERQLDRTPLIQVMLALQNTALPPLELEGLTLRLRESASESAKFELGFTFQEHAQGLLGVIEYRSELFAPTTIALGAAV